MRIAAFFVITVASVGLSGCSGDTSSSPELTKAEVQQGQDRRFDEIDKNPNLSAEDKEKMKAAIRGEIPGKGGR